MNKLLIMLLLLVMLPVVSSQFSDEDLKNYVFEVNRQSEENIISSINSNMDSKSDQCLSSINVAVADVEVLVNERIRAGLIRFGILFFGLGLSLLFFFKLVTWKVEPRRDKGENKRIKELEGEIVKVNKEYSDYRLSVEKVVGGLIPKQEEVKKK